MLLEYSPAYAASIAPAKIIPSPGAPAPEVRELLAQGLNAARGVQSRFIRFQKQATDADRANLWNTGPEYQWFAAYDKTKYNSLKQVFDRIAVILASTRLDVICDDTDKRYAHALPGIWKIHLGIKWIHDTDREERIQTFVHEAAHIAGRSVAKESAWYGPTQAHKEAHKHRPLRPHMALRSADNIGYFAIDLAKNFLSYV
ncbi:MAG: hypothetical protein KDK05_05335 [Candidatus Competibacteraceae bacterium]|nr:hypothetical protein [Candidatus Competibacteraceae bacterium]